MVMSKLSVIVPVYYNADTLELLYKDMQEKYSRLCRQKISMSLSWWMTGPVMTHGK